MSDDRTVLFGLGANLPWGSLTPAETLALAVGELAKREITVLAVSRLYASPAFPAGAGPDYVNAAVLGVTGLDPASVLQAAHATEALFGRTRASRWAARSLDIDVLAHGGRVLPDAAGWRRWAELGAGEQRSQAPQELILPHPRLAERAFVLVPLAEIAGAWRHPVTGLGAAQMLKALPPADVAALRPVSAGGDWADSALVNHGRCP